MNPVGGHGLACLDDTDYAAVALAMQCNAVAITEAITTSQTALAAYGNRFVRRFVSTSSSTSGANSGVVLADNTAVTGVLTAAMGVLPTGWYSTSGSLSYQATGAVTVSSYRRSVITVNFSTSQVPPKMFQCVTTDSNNGLPDSMTVNGWFYSDGVVSTTLQLSFGHGNAASSMTVPAGAVLTVRFMTTGLVT